MATSKSNDPFREARKYAGRNSGPSVNPATSKVYGVNQTRPYVRVPNGPDFDERWQPRNKGGE